MKAAETVAALNALRDQIMKGSASADYDTTEVVRRLRAAADAVQRQTGSALEGDFATQGGGGNPA
jgi:hypothetical protein